MSSARTTTTEAVHQPEILFGQLVIGPAGSGKTTYCKVLAQHLAAEREVIVVNLDPDNERLPYEAHINIDELVNLAEVMENENLGPNGSFLYCMDYLNQNLVWLHRRIREEFDKAKKRAGQAAAEENRDGGTRRRVYALFDCPGQIELFTNYPSFKNIIHSLLRTNPELCKDAPETNLDIRLVTVNLVDSHYTNDPSKFITVILNSLVSMLHIEAPHINVLSKVDLIEQQGETDFNIDFYCELPDLDRLVERLSDDPFLARYKKLTKKIAEIIENYAIVSYVPMDINDDQMIKRLIGLVDRANGYQLTDMSSNVEALNYYQSLRADFEASKYGNLM